MDTQWAVDNLQTIRTLMERSAVYRRALAPIMMLAGVMGIAGGLTGWWFKLESNFSFILFWMAVAIVSLVGALVLVRRQALTDSEPFWSPPTRRVCQALLPAFLVGLMLASYVLLFAGRDIDIMLQYFVILLWTWFYGCAVHAAGFFMPRGVRWFGWIFVLIGGALPLLFSWSENHQHLVSAHLLMGGIFGGLHLAYGIYLYFTEQKNPVA